MRIFWDTNLFVYLLEDYGSLTEATVAFRDRIRQHGDRLLTSTLTVGEILVRPLEAAPESVDSYRDALRAAATIIPFDEAAAVHYAGIRRDRQIRPPDAIQMACAAAGGADLFVTNDSRLSRKVIAGVPMVSSLAEVPL